MEKKKPAKEFKEGAILGSVWTNEGANGTFYNVTIKRMFKRDGEDAKWEYSDSFGERDLQVVAQVSSDAYNWIAANPAAPAEEKAA